MIHTLHFAAQARALWLTQDPTCGQVDVDFRGRSELLTTAAALLERLRLGEEIDEEATHVQLEALADHLGSDFLLALRLHLQFQREAREEAAARSKAATEAEAATVALLSREAEEESARAASEHEGEAAARALHTAHEADAAAEALERARIEADLTAARRLDAEERDATAGRGWLLKAGERNTSYQARFFILARRELAWYASDAAADSGGAPKGFVRLPGSEVRVTPSDSGAKFRFALTPPPVAERGQLPPPVLPVSLERVGRTLQLEATRVEDLVGWVELLQHACTRLRPELLPVPRLNSLVSR